MPKRKVPKTPLVSTPEIQKWVQLLENQTEHPLNPSEIEAILFVKRELSFSDELMDYLVNHCINLKKPSGRYIKAAAVTWHDASVKTPADAIAYMQKRDNPNLIPIMQYLDITTAPGEKELEFVNRWTLEYGFSLDIIKLACDRAVRRTDNNRFNYCNTILTKWHSEGAIDISDIKKLDDEFKKSKEKEKTKKKPGFDFPQHDYDFEALEKELMQN